MNDRIQKDSKDCTAEELSDFLQVVMGVEVKGKETKQQLLAKLTQIGWAVPFITVAAPEAAPSREDGDRPSMSTRIVKKGGKDRKEIRIMIHANDKPGGDRPVPVGVNGVMMLIERGKACWVPEEYVHVLINAVEIIYPEYDQNADMLGGLSHPKPVPSYPFSYS